MDDRSNPYVYIRADGLDVHLDRRMRVAALRFFNGQGEFARQCRAAIGVELPGCSRAVEVPGAPLGQECILAWRNPTQVLALVSDAQAFAGLLSLLQPTLEGCCVDQSGGLWVLRLTGSRVADLLLRIGNAASVPEPGAAHVTRIADMAVLSLCVKAGEILLVVDRAYAEHLLNWIRATLGDLGATASAR